MFQLPLIIGSISSIAEDMTACDMIVSVASYYWLYIILKKGGERSVFVGFQLPLIIGSISSHPL